MAHSVSFALHSSSQRTVEAIVRFSSFDDGERRAFLNVRSRIPPVRKRCIVNNRYASSGLSGLMLERLMPLIPCFTSSQRVHHSKISLSFSTDVPHLLQKL